MKKMTLKYPLVFSSVALSVSLIAGAQTVPAPTNAQDNRAMTSNDSNHPDVTRPELANFDHFLDAHPEIAEQLRRDPALVDNQKFVRDHPALQDYLQAHPEVAAQLSTNPNALLRDESRYDGARNRGAGVNRPELMRFDQFLDSHPEIAEQLRREPSRADDPEFVTNHPALQVYLQDHPEVQAELRQNPDALMQTQARLDHPEDQRGLDRGADSNRPGLENFRRFLDSHPEITEQLRKDPSLVDNVNFQRNHPALQTYLQDHPEVRAEIRSNPNGFMQAEARYDHFDNRTGDHRPSDFGQFLNAHGRIATELSHNPALVKDKAYMDNCPDLQAYLSAHPDVRDQLMQNPEGFMRSAQQFRTAPATPLAPAQANPPAGVGAPTAKPKP